MNLKRPSKEDYENWSMKIPTDADLSEAAVEHALDLIKEQLKEELEWKDYSIYSQFGIPSFTITTSYQNLKVATRIAFTIDNIDKEVTTVCSKGMEWDSWTVEYTRLMYRNKELVKKKYSVWSKGA
mgnify:CR=1 FL=1